MKDRCKWLLLVVMAVILLLCTQNGVWAKAPLYKVMYVKSEAGLNLRAKPSTDSRIIAKLIKGQSMIVGDNSGPWIKVFVKAQGEIQLGWVHSSFVTSIDPAEQEVYSYEDMLSDDLMQIASILIIYNIILDAKFLASTKPGSIEEFSEQLLVLRYKADKSRDDDWKHPSKTLREGGDCEDLTTFVIAKALPCFGEVGFIMMSPEYVFEDSTDSTHIAAIIRSDNGKLAIIDLACSLGRLKILPFDKYFKIVNQGNLTRYRIWWMLLPNSAQPSIKCIPK
jgi:hypothetical protein